MGKGRGAENKELREMVFKLREKKYTQQYIGDLCGISKQRVNTILKQKDMKNTEAKRKYRMFYWPALRKFLDENDMSVREFCILLGEQNQSTSNLARFLYGYTDTITIQKLNRILEVTGMTYEEIFMQGAEDECTQEHSKGKDVQNVR